MRLAAQLIPKFLSPLAGESQSEGDLGLGLPIFPWTALIRSLFTLSKPK
jgi:hypothetical protein